MWSVCRFLSICQGVPNPGKKKISLNSFMHLCKESWASWKIISSCLCNVCVDTFENGTNSFVIFASERRRPRSIFCTDRRVRITWPVQPVFFLSFFFLYVVHSSDFCQVGLWSTPFFLSKVFIKGLCLGGKRERGGGEKGKSKREIRDLLQIWVRILYY